MNKPVFQTITGRKLQLADLSRREREFLAAVRREYEKEPEWSQFATWWMLELKRAGLGSESIVYRVCQDLEARLGIAQGKVAPPDYRDYLADLIEERFGSRYRFCQQTGVDPGHLSRVLSSRSDLSIQGLQKILHELNAALIIQTAEASKSRFSTRAVLRPLATATA